MSHGQPEWGHTINATAILTVSWVTAIYTMSININIFMEKIQNHIKSNRRK